MKRRLSLFDGEKELPKREKHSRKSDYDFGRSSSSSRKENDRKSSKYDTSKKHGRTSKVDDSKPRHKDRTLNSSSTSSSSKDRSRSSNDSKSSHKEREVDSSSSSTKKHARTSKVDDSKTSPKETFRPFDFSVFLKTPSSNSNLKNDYPIPPSSKENVSNFSASTSISLDYVQLKTEFNKMEAECKKLKSELETSKSDYRNLEEITQQFQTKTENEIAEEKKRTEKAVAEFEKVNEQISIALPMVEQFQEQAFEAYQQLAAEQEQSANLVEQNNYLEHQISEMNTLFNNEKKAANLRESELQNRCQEYRRRIQSEEAKIFDLQLQFGKQNKSFEEMAQQLREAKSKGDRGFSGLRNAKKQQQDKIDALQKELDEVVEKFEYQKTEMQEQIFKTTVKNEGLEDEISAYQKLVESKVLWILELEKEHPQMQKRILAEKIEIASQTVETQCNELNPGLSKLKNQNDSLQQQINQLIKEKAALTKLSEQKQDNLGKMEAENQKLKEKLQTCKNEDENSIKDRAREMFNDWKNGEKEKRRDEKRNCKCAEKDQRILELEKELEEEKEMNKTLFDSAANISAVNNGPKWLVPEEVCQRIFAENPDIKVFLPQFVTHLFNCAELLLPEEKLSPEKMEEAKNVILHFFKPEENNGLKKLYFGELKSVLNLKRYPARARAYRSCDTNRSVAFTSDGTKFYYSLMPDNTWKPCSDKKCQNIMAFRKTAFSPFGIPTKFASAEHILILQKSSVDESKIHKMSTKTGVTEVITKSKAEM